MDDSPVIERVHRRLREEHAETLTAVIKSGRVVAESTERPRTDGRQIRVALERQLRHSELLEALVSMLQTAAAAVGKVLQSPPVPAPPFVVVTSRGPICRGTLSDGRRLLVEILLFTLARDPRRYRPFDGPLSKRLRVQFRS